MTTAQSIVVSAFREGNITPVGKTPTTDELNEGLALLNSLILTTLGYEIGEELSDWLVPAPQRTAPVAADYPQFPYPQSLDAELLGTPFTTTVDSNVWPYPPANSRIVFGGVTATAYFPEAPNDGARMAIVQGSGAGDGGASGQILTLNGNGRTIETTSTQAFVDPITARQWLYRADKGDWVAIVVLALADTVPFPQDLDDYWITALNLRLSRRFGRAVSQETTAVFKRMQSYASARYRQAANTTYGSNQIPNTYQSYRPGRWDWLL